MSSQTHTYTDRLSSVTNDIEHWELLTLMLVTGAALLGLYVVLLLLVYPFMTFIPFPIYLVLAIVLGGVGAYLSVRVNTNSLKANNEPLPEDAYPELHQMVESLSNELGVKKPELYIRDSDVLNAYAVGYRENGAIIITSEMLELLSEDELEPVLAHELAHLYYGDNIVITATRWLEKAFILLARAIAYTLIILSNFITAFAQDRPETQAEANRRVRRQRRLTSIIVGIGAGLVLVPRNALSRYREFVADHTAAELTSEDETISALEKLRESAHEVETEDEPEGLRSTLGPVSYSDRPGGIRGRFHSLVHADHPSLDRRVELIESDFGDSDEPASPTDEGATLGTFTRFGLTFAPLLIILAPIVVVGAVVMETVAETAVFADPNVVVALVGLVLMLSWLVSLFAFPWSMLFAAGGTPVYGFVATMCTILFLFSGSILSGIPLLEYLPLIAYFGLVGIAGLQLRDVTDELR